LLEDLHTSLKNKKFGLLLSDGHGAEDKTISCSRDFYGGTYIKCDLKFFYRIWQVLKTTIGD
jgi:hypothetical protein